jgi:hypothetical protein
MSRVLLKVAGIEKNPAANLAAAFSEIIYGSCVGC